MFKKEIITVKDTLFIVKRKVKRDLSPVVDVWKEHLHCDTVFHKDEIYYFCQKIDEAQIIENE